jgi:glutamate racemase
MIGIFDSGLGGLLVMRQIVHRLPQYDYLYLGDTLHVPYGNRSDEAVYELTRKACDFLFSHGCQLIILACNTATAKALPRLQQEYLPTKQKTGEERILGVVRPLAEYVAGKEFENVGVIGTRGTIKSKVYVKEIKKLNEKIKVHGQAAPLLVPLIEEGWSQSDPAREILRDYLKMLKLNEVQSLVLGCTHYAAMLPAIRDEMLDCVVPDPGEIIADSLADYLQRHIELESQLGKNNHKEFFVTDLTDNFVKIANQFWGEEININKIN